MSNDYWKQPLKWNKEACETGVTIRVFCASMADVFEDHYETIEARQRLWTLIEETPSLIWMLLTKRPENIHKMIAAGWWTDWPANVWIGTSVENQEAAKDRIPWLLATPALVRFLSCEPLLSRVDLAPWMLLTDSQTTRNPISWVIVGGESGHHARAMHPAWARDLRDQCAAHGIAYFFKQWGEYRVQNAHFEADQYITIHGDRAYDLSSCTIASGYIGMEKVGKKEAGSLLDGRAHKEFPKIIRVG